MVYVPPTIAVYLSAHTFIDSSQNNIAMRLDLFRDWYRALAGRESLASWMRAKGINDKFAIAVHKFVASTSSEEEGIQVCLVLAVHLLADDHLPPLELQAGVKQEFVNGALHDLYSRLQETDGSGSYMDVILESINRLEGRQVQTQLENVGRSL
jgi:hypothetical protein